MADREKIKTVLKNAVKMDESVIFSEAQKFFLEAMRRLVIEKYNIDLEYHHDSDGSVWIEIRGEFYEHGIGGAEITWSK